MPRRAKKPGAKGASKGTGWLEWRSGQYIARFEINGRRFSRATGEKDKEKARERMAEFITEERLPEEKKQLQRQGRIDQIDQQLAEIEDAKPTILLTEAYDAFEGSRLRKECGAGELRQYKCYLTRFADWMASHYPAVREMREVTLGHTSEFADAIAKTTTPTTFNRHILLLKGAWKVLKKPGKIVENPWEDIQKRRAVAHSRRELTVEELMKVLTTAEGELQVLFALGIYTGQRLGDCALLDWSCIDLVRSFISLVQAKTRRHHEKRVVIPIHATLYRMLERVPSKLRKGYLLPETAALYKRDPAALSKRISKTFQACEITTSTKEKGKRAKVDVGFHSLRHTFVSLTANAGASLGNVRSMTGHATTDMALHYFHENEDGLKKTVAMIPAIGDASTPAKPAEGEFDAFLNGLDHAALKRLRKAVDERLVGK